MKTEAASLEEMFALMRQYGVRSLKFEGVEVVMAPGAAPAPAAALAPGVEHVAAGEVAAPDSDACPCGHSLDVEHTPTGCGYGCPVALCASRSDVAPA